MRTSVELIAAERQMVEEDYEVIRLPDYFRPIKQAKDKLVSLSTWGIGTGIEKDVLTKPKSGSRLLVGYSKHTHDLIRLQEAGMAIQSLGWQVRFLPNFHTKIWIVGRIAYVGSCNLGANTIINGMWPISASAAISYFDTYWYQAKQVSRSTRLQLIPQAKKHVEIRV